MSTRSLLGVVALLPVMWPPSLVMQECVRSKLNPWLLCAVCTNRSHRRESWFRGVDYLCVSLLRRRFWRTCIHLLPGALEVFVTTCHLYYCVHNVLCSLWTSLGAMQSCSAWDLASQRSSSSCWSRGPQIWTTTVSFLHVNRFAKLFFAVPMIKATACEISDPCNSVCFLQSVWPCQQWWAWWAESFWWWAGGGSARSWPVSSWSDWCWASLSPPLSSSLPLVGKK